jgi:transcriptional regulator with XRE-family HTH domain
MHKQNKEYKVKIGANVRKWRELKGWQQKDLADNLDYSVSTISNIERDSHGTTIHQVEEIADALEINFIQLFTDPQNYINTFNDSPYSVVGSIGTQQNQIDKEAVQILVEHIAKKDEQNQNFMKDIVNSITSLFKKEAS